MANNPDGKYETYHEVPESKYFFISGFSIAIHKGFFKYWSLFLIGFSVVSTLIAAYTNWWQTIIILTATFFYIQHWYVGWPATAITLGIGYIWYERRKKQHTKLKAQRERARRIQDIILSGGDKKK